MIESSKKKYATPRFLLIIKAAIKALYKGCLWKITKTWFSNTSCVVCYCSSASHLDTVLDILYEILNSERSLILVLGFNTVPDNIKNNKRVLLITSSGFKILPLIRSKLFITAHVGFPRNFIPSGSRVIHLLVSIAGLDGVYANTHFDSYDYIFCAGEHHIDDFIRFANKTDCTGKILIRGGYPKLDSQIKWLKKKQQSKENRDNQKVVIYAPTHVYEVNEQFSSLRHYGIDIVRTLLNSNFTLIFRPHPASCKSQDKDLIRQICSEHENNPHFLLDRSSNYIETYANADLMVTDVSGTGFTFAFTFLKPVIFFAPNIDAEKGVHGIHFTSRENIGAVVRDISELKNRCTSLLENKLCIEKEIEAFRNKTVFNICTSAKYFCKCLTYIEKCQMDKDWVSL